MLTTYDQDPLIVVPKRHWVHYVYAHITHLQTNLCINKVHQWLLIGLIRDGRRETGEKDRSMCFLHMICHFVWRPICLKVNKHQCNSINLHLFICSLIIHQRLVVKETRFKKFSRILSWCLTWQATHEIDLIHQGSRLIGPWNYMAFRNRTPNNEYPVSAHHIHSTSITTPRTPPMQRQTK